MDLNDLLSTLPAWGEGSVVTPHNVELKNVPVRLGGRSVMRAALIFELHGINREQYTSVRQLKGDDIATRFGQNPGGIDLEIEGYSLRNAVCHGVTQLNVVTEKGVERIACRVVYRSLSQA